MYNKNKQPNTTQRVTLLKELITEGISLSFSNVLLLGYQRQLNTLQQEIKQDNDKRTKWKQQNK